MATVKTPTFKNAAEERYYRQTNPNSDYAKQVDMRYLRQTEDLIKNNQGVSQSQMNNYNNTAKKWNYTTYDPNRAAVQNASKPIDTNQYKTQTATIEDIAKKYGFDFSRDYAKTQAEAEAQARRNANANATRKNETSKQENLQAIDNNLMNMADSLDRNYFQQGLQQAQNQTNSGLNAGIASDQNLRLAMARQAEMGSSYRDANLGRMQENNRYSNEAIRLMEDLGLINQQALAREDSLYNDRLMQGAGLAQNLDQFNLSQNQAMLQAAFQNQANQMDSAQYLMNYDYQKGRDEKTDYWNEIARKQWESEQKWARLMDAAGLTGMYNGSATMDREQFNWQKQMDQAQLALQKQAAARSFSSGGGSGRSSSSSSGGSSSGSSASSLANQFRAQQASSSKSNIDKYYENQNSKLTNSVVRKPAVLPGNRITPATDPSLSAWAKMQMMLGG